MIKKFVRILALFAALVLLLFLCVAVVLKAVFPEPRLKAVFINGIRGYTHRDARIARVSWGLLSGVRVTGFTLSQHPDFKAGTFLTVRSLTVETGVLQFLRHMTGSVSLDSPVLTVTVQKQPSAQPVSAAAKKKDDEKRTRRVPPVIPRFRVADGVVDVVVGAAGKRIARVESLVLNADEVALTRPFTVFASGIIRSGGALLLAECPAVVDITERQVRLRDAVLKSGAASLRINGSISGILDRDGVTYDLSVQGDRALLDEVLAVFSRNEIIQLLETEKLHLRITGNGENLTVTDLSR